MKRVFVVAGEISGDAHGAGLMRHMTEGAPVRVAFAGLGGPRMREQGGEAVEDWVGEAGVVGLWEVLKKYAWFRARFRATLRRIADWKPDAVILIDYPGFNLRMAKALRAAGTAARVIYYISPQVWAWHRGRIPKMARILDLMLCIFPFEKALYESSGLRTEFVGHPFGDAMAHLRDAGPRQAGLVGFFPGSREREVAKLFPVLRDAASSLARQFPGRQLAFEAAAASDARAEQMRAMLVRHSGPDIRIVTGDAHGLMQRAEVGAVASGTASLEAAFFGLPYCLVYKVAPLTGLVARVVMRVDFLGMANIIAGREVVRELLQRKCTTPAVAAELARLLASAPLRSELQRELGRVTADLRRPGASRHAAEAVWAELSPP